MSECDAEPNTKRVSVSHPVPRDPQAYRATVHFGQRLRERVPEELRDRVVRETISRGWLSGTTPPQSGDDIEVRQFFKFEREIEGSIWRVVVGIRPEAFLQEGKKHVAVTVVEVDGDGD